LFVIPAKAGIQFLQYPAVALDSGLRRDDGLFRRFLDDRRRGDTEQNKGASSSPAAIDSGYTR
jgi:hypothetical protein